MQRILILGLLGWLLAGCQHYFRSRNAPPAALRASARVEKQQLILEAVLQNRSGKPVYALTKQDVVELNCTMGPWRVEVVSPSGRQLRVCQQCLIKAARPTSYWYAKVNGPSNRVTLLIHLTDLITTTHCDALPFGKRSPVEEGVYRLRLLYEDRNLWHRRAVKFAESNLMAIEYTK